MTKTLGVLWSMASAETSPSNQQPSGNWILPTAVGLGSGSFPSQAFRWDPSPGQHLCYSLVRDLEGENLARPDYDS